jgi:Domain of unknown function (DUF222)
VWAAFNSPGALASAAEFGLDWGSARASVVEVAREACARVPQEWELEGPSACLSLGDAANVDEELLAAMLGPEGLGGQFGQGGHADALRPGPILSALTEQAVADADFLTDDQLTGAIQAVRRLQARERWKETVLVAQFARRRDAQLADAKARGIPPGRRQGEFPADELAAELLVTANQADASLEADRQLTTRLSKTLAGMAAGIISGDRADTIAFYTAGLSDADAARADEILAAAAPQLRADQLARKAAALEMKLDPEAARIRKEHAKNTRQRVEVRREQSGNASLAGRELGTADALACKAYIDAQAVKIRNHGRLDDPLGMIRARVMIELLQGRDPAGLLRPRPRPAVPAPRPAAGDRPEAGHPSDGSPRADGLADPGYPGYPVYPCLPGDPQDPGPDAPDLDDSDLDDSEGLRYAGPGGRPSWDSDEDGNARWNPFADEPARSGPLRPGMPAPLPAAINLLIPVGNLLGWSGAPAHANGIGLLGPDETQALVQAASRHPRTRWCATLVNPDGTAAAHACAPGQHPWTPPPPTPSPSARRETPPPTPPPDEASNATHFVRLRDLLAELNLVPEPVARDHCDHDAAEPRYTPSRRLKHLLRARTQTCDAPGCNAQAVHCDQDHTTPWPDGATCQCNLGPKCRRHHRAKQAPGWHVEQPQPGVIRWTLPNGRTHTTTPTVYDL